MGGAAGIAVATTGSARASFFGGLQTRKVSIQVVPPRLIVPIPADHLRALTIAKFHQERLLAAGCPGPIALLAPASRYVKPNIVCGGGGGDAPHVGYPLPAPDNYDDYASMTWSYNLSNGQNQLGDYAVTGHDVGYAPQLAMTVTLTKLSTRQAAQASVGSTVGGWVFRFLRDYVLSQGVPPCQHEVRPRTGA